MNVYSRFQHHCFGMVGKQWFINVRMTVIFLVNHFWFQLISIVIHMQAILVSLSLSHWYPGSGVVLDCIDSWSLHLYLLSKKTSPSKKHDKMMPRSAAIFEKTRVLHQKGLFPVKSKLRKLLWPRGYEINLEKVHSFILEQIRIIQWNTFTDPSKVVLLL